MKVKTKDFLNELSRLNLTAEYEYGRIEISGNNEAARDHYRALLKVSPEFEGALIWELAQTDANIMDCIEERRAIRWVEIGDDSIRGAIMCNITN